MRHSCFMLTLAMVLAVCDTALSRDASQPSAQTEILANLRPGHPRLFIVEGDIERIRKLIQEHPDARKLRDDLHALAVKLLDEPTVEHKLVGPRLLAQSRACLDRVATLALLYRLEGDRRFAARAEKEMLAAAAFPDWNPSHFLDTAEMSNALGIGYDWLYDVLSADSRATIRTALIEKGLRPGLDGHRKAVWWTRTTNNWNQVCNGGLTVGALAIADEEPELAAEIIDYARKSIPLAMTSFQPDGGCPEGPGYWHYAMRYTAFYHAALLTALGTDFGLAASSGYAQAGLFRIHCTGPTRHTFNFADGGSVLANASLMMFMARVFDRPVYAWHQRTLRAGTDAFELVWYDPRGSDADIRALPLDAHFTGIDVVFMRSAWNDPNAVFVGFKGGNNAASHSNLDLGTFIVDALGERWAMELGADDYNLPGYFGNKRWTYYRLRTEGQNTLVLNGENQDTKAKAPIIAFRSSPQQALAVADLSAAYTQHARRVQRGVALLDRSHVLITDEIEAASPVEITWAMHTPAVVSIEGPQAVLRQKGKRMVARLIEPADAAWAIREVNPEPPQRPLKGVRKLVVELRRAGETPARIRVLLSPASTSADPSLPPPELKRWIQPD